MASVTGPTDTDQVTANEQRRLVVNANYEIFVLVMTIFQVANSILWVWLPGLQEQRVVTVVSLGISLFLIVDAFHRLRKAPDRRRFVARFHGWLLFVGSLPVPFLAVFRLVWYWLVIRTLRRRDFAAIGEVVIDKRAQSTLLAVIVAAIVVLETASILILHAEAPSAQANIHDASDAVWWTIVTIATVGYGDKYPVTTSGRVIGVAVIIVGVGLFSVLTSYMAQWFLRSRAGGAQPEKGRDADPGEYAELLARLDVLTALLEKQGTTYQREVSELRTRLAEIEDKSRKE